MAAVRQKGTTAERCVAGALRKLGLSYRLNVRSLPGSPDMANKKKRWAVFVKGCFWHHHRGCPRATVPKSNEAFWLEKFAANRRRDAAAIRALRRRGFRVVIIWECRLRDVESLLARLSDVPEAGRIQMREAIDH